MAGFEAVLAADLGAGLAAALAGLAVLAGALLAGGFGIAGLRAQTVLGDPRDAARTFASNCSACHKSPQGLAKSGQVAGFLRQHYTSGPEMSAAMAAYLVAAGSAPASKKGAAATASAEGVAPTKMKSKKGEQLAAQPPATSDAAQHRTLRGKQQRPSPLPPEQIAAPSSPVVQPTAEDTKQPAEEAKQVTASAAAATAPQPAAPASSGEPAVVVFNIPLPSMPDAPPPELTQSVFASSPLP